LTEFINLPSVFLQKAHRIGIEFFGKMKISKIEEHCIEVKNLEKIYIPDPPQKNQLNFFIHTVCC